eukprot:420141-Prymnesium_polylepis.1
MCAARHIKADDGEWCPPGAGSVENANTIAHEPVPNGTTSCGFRHSLRTRSQRTIGSGVEVFAIDRIAAVMQSNWCCGGLPSVAACWPTVIGRHLACIRIHQVGHGRRRPRHRVDGASTLLTGQRQWRRQHTARSSRRVESRRTCIGPSDAVKFEQSREGLACLVCRHRLRRRNTARREGGVEARLRGSERARLGLLSLLGVVITRRRTSGAGLLRRLSDHNAQTNRRGRNRAHGHSELSREGSYARGREINCFSDGSPERHPAKAGPGGEGGGRDGSEALRGAGGGWRRTGDGRRAPDGERRDKGRCGACGERA